jgi:periplasmic copper chaperone A
MPGHALARWVTLPTVGAIALLTFIAGAVPAAAHVSVRADNPQVGEFTKLTFRAPSESSDSATTKLEITVPQDPPVLFVRLRPHPGWKITTKSRKLDRPQLFDGEKVDALVTAIVLTAEKGDGIPPRQFDEFDLTAGPLPDVRSLEFPVLQEYEDGRKVRWQERRTAGIGTVPAPRYPVPRIELHDPAAVRSTERHPVADPLARWMGGGGLVLAAIGLGLALLRRRPRAVPIDRFDQMTPTGRR